MEPLSTQIRNLIRAEMKLRGLSIRDLAKILGCTKENVDQILRIGEREGKGMKTVIADRIFEALGLEVIVDVSSKGSRQEVKCKRCGCQEMYDDGTVEWPTT